MDSDKERICYCTGNIIAVRPGEALKPILGFHTFLAELAAERGYCRPELADEPVDELFHALADATRRDILRRCVAASRRCPAR
ncbi:MAG: hypothetical protein HC794_06480, partial [Nitrospiraceae bacterium]|nr:hypothetical protein [Nitrospiraceae bacterium]